MQRVKRVFLSTILFSALAACDDGSNEPDVEDRDVVFDGAEVRDELAANPAARFFVDLRGDSRVRFTQEDAPLDFTNFLVQCPSMPHPIPMTDFASLLDIDLDRREFSLQSASAADITDFRDTELPTCTLTCPTGPEESLGEDCVWDC
jgi:hypothetical protein